ncbi:transmembrane protein 174 [Colossoma macropomum]|uniref:transmembrane protein 174 n=1 Tax=Colossoma macropomum TaxID=42526 RepID=UPI0018643433|nr:transmembrane protein 174 [Colossoma macropomum]
MKRYSVRDLWKNVTGGQPQEASSGASLSESNGTDVSSVTQTTRQSSDDFSMNVVSGMPAQPPSGPDSQVSDGDKAGATLLFSGIFLSLVGMTFTAMGWINYEVSTSFEWTQLLGPVLLSVGGTFVLISICKFRMFSCQACKVPSDEGVPEIDLPPLAGPSFVFSGINQPITFHRATVVQYIPPPYTSVVQDRSLTPINRFQSSQQPLAVTVSAPPQYYSVYPMDNPAFSDDNETQEQTAYTRETRIQNQSEEVEEEKAEASESTSPPAYEDLFPTTLCDSSSR